MEDVIERIKDFIREEAEEFYYSEDNYNNADITSGQKIYSEIIDVEEEIINRLLNKTTEDMYIEFVKEIGIDEIGISVMVNGKQYCGYISEAKED
jgi:hypothetical protein